MPAGSSVIFCRSKALRLLENGFQPVRVVLHALALLWLDRGESAPAIAGRIPLAAQTIRNLIRRYQADGLDGALYDKVRPGPKRLLDEAQSQRVVAMVCSDPPPGRARWTVRLIAEEAVRRKILPGVGRETIRLLNPQEPVVCLDQKPLVLHGEARSGANVKPGRSARRDYEYVRHGTANAFCAVEPKAGRHFVWITRQSTPVG